MNFKDFTTKSAISASGQWSFSGRMLNSTLHRPRDMLLNAQVFNIPGVQTHVLSSFSERI